MAAYADAATLRTYLDQVRTDATTAGTDAVLTSILTRATGIINNTLAAALGLPSFAFAAYGAAATKIITSYGGAYLTIPAHQLGSVTAVAYQSGYNPVAYTAISTDEWDEEADGRLYRPGHWGRYLNTTDTPRYRVTAVWGYGPAPDEIVQVCLELAVNIWRSRSKGSFTEYTGAAGGGQMRVVGALTKEQKEVLEGYANRVREIAV